MAVTGPSEPPPSASVRGVAAAPFAAAAPAGLLAADAWRMWCVLAAWALLTVMIPAGGLGVAPALGLVGAAVLLGEGLTRIHGAAPDLLQLSVWGRTPAAVWGLAAFVLWAMVSFLWSPFARPDGAIKLALSLPLYGAFLWACAQLSPLAREPARLMLAVMMLGACAVFAFEMLSDGALTRAGGREGRPQGELWRNLGHGVSTAVALFPAFAAMAWTRGAAGRALAILAGVILAAGGVVFGLTVNALGLVAAIAGMALAAWRPRRAVIVAGGVAIASIVFAPAFALLAAAPQSWSEVLPLSWRQRLEIWRAAVGFIGEKPFFGHGFDAARTRDVYEVLAGKRFDLMPLHPHNAGLHIWYEAGIVGVTLFTLSLGMLVRRVVQSSLLHRTQAMAIAGSFTGFSAMAAVSYGVWQEWWVASAFAAAGACLLAGADASVTRSEEGRR